MPKQPFLYPWTSAGQPSLQIHHTAEIQQGVRQFLQLFKTQDLEPNQQRRLLSWRVNRASTPP